MSTTLTNVKVWDGFSESIDSGVDAIVLEGGRFSKVGSSDDLKSSQSRDMGGRFLIPGLIDAHVHMCLNPDIMAPEDQDKPTDEELMAQMVERAGRMVEAGITTARDLGGGRWLELEIRDRINSGDINGPRLICAGQPVTSPGGHCHFWGGEAANAGEAVEVIARQLDHGADLIKVMATGGNLTKGSRPVDAQFDAETLGVMVSRARAHNLCVAAHCHGTAGIRNAAEAGVTTIEHCSWVSEEGWAKGFDPEAAGVIADKGIWVSPTVNLGWKRRIGTGDYESLVRDNFRRLRDAGVTLIASTDAGIPRVYHHDLPRAIPVFAHFAGLSNVDALRASCSDCAEAIGLGEMTGRIAPGYSADFLLLESNPLDNLDALESPGEVWVRGDKVN